MYIWSREARPENLRKKTTKLETKKTLGTGHWILCAEVRPELELIGAGAELSWSWAGLELELS